MERSLRSRAETGPRADPDRLRSFCARALVTTEMSPEDARLAAEVMVRTDLRGVHTHGIRLLPGYVRQLQQGGADPRARFELVRDTASAAVVDGHSAMGMVTAAKATALAAERASGQGMAMVLVRRGNHFGAAGHYALSCAERGLFALVMSNAPANMTVTGSRAGVLSNAPIAYASPSGSGPPIVFDVALSAVAGSKVIMAAERGEQVPEGWFVDEDGAYNPDPRSFVTPEGIMKGTLVPMAGHKGYGFALMVELLAGALSGAAMTGAVASWARHPSRPGDTGHSILAIDPSAFIPREDYLARVGALFAEIKAAPTAPGVDRILLPGELESEHEQESLTSGIELEPMVWEQLGSLARRLSLEQDLEAVRA